MNTVVPVRVIAWCVAVALVALPVIGVLEGWFAAGRWPIRHLTVHSTFRHVSADEVRRAVRGDLHDGFFATRLSKVRADVAALPWVASVEVSKHWPDTVTISVHERHPFARWNGTHLISRRGVLFSTPGAAQLTRLPSLSGPDARMHDVVAFYVRARAALATDGLSLRGVVLSGRDSWSVTVNGGTRIVIGGTDPRQRLAQFVAVYPRLVRGHAHAFTYADLRYTNGFAVRWPQSPPTNPSTDEGHHNT